MNSNSLFQGALFLSVCVLAAAHLPGQTNPPAITPAQRTELFDGKSLAGWTFTSRDTNANPAAIWSVQDGVIRCLGQPYGYARTVGNYRDYQLHAEWRWPDAAGNSGLFLNITGADKVWPMCLEVQLQAGNAGDVRCNGGSSVLGKSTALPRRVPGTEKPNGEWNTCDIVCRSNTVTIKINGTLQNEITGASVESGAIGLQAEGKLAEFRNLVLEPLPAAQK